MKLLEDALKRISNAEQNLLGINDIAKRTELQLQIANTMSIIAIGNCLSHLLKNDQCLVDTKVQKVAKEVYETVAQQPVMQLEPQENVQQIPQTEMVAPQQTSSRGTMSVDEFVPDMMDDFVPDMNSQTNQVASTTVPEETSGQLPQPTEETVPFVEIIKNTFIQLNGSVIVPDGAGGTYDACVTLSYFVNHIDQDTNEFPFGGIEFIKERFAAFSGKDLSFLNAINIKPFVAELLVLYNTLTQEQGEALRKCTPAYDPANM